MNKTIEIKDMVAKINDYIIIDLRSPDEYHAGCVKGAVNIPLLDNEARKLVGTLYKTNQEAAYAEGLKVGTERLPKIYEEVRQLKKEQPDKKIVFYCFRGGTRSSSVNNMMNMLRVNTVKLNGGYKQYRQYILEHLNKYLKQINWIVITGNTGSGKTIILNKLKDKGYPVIDLEALANHRGSVFGAMGLDGEVGQKKFEDDLFYELKNYADSGLVNIFVESESRKIGRLSLPNELNDRIRVSNHILLNVGLDKRVEIIKETYQVEEIDKEYIKEVLAGNDHFKGQLGKTWVPEMVNLLDNGDLDTFIKKMLSDYYDKLYDKSHKRYKYDLVIDSDDLDQVVGELEGYYGQVTGVKRGK